MKASEKRKHFSPAQIRNDWQSNLPRAEAAGFCRYTIEAIEDDRDDLRLCWCCGDQGYQEMAHIIPHSLGGKCTPPNLFLLCRECHVQSPDFLDRSAFITFVNRNAGRASGELSRTVETALNSVRAKMKALYEEDPEKAMAALNSLGEQFDKALEDTGNMVSAHGAYVSHSTRMARIEAVCRDAVKTDDS